MKIKYLILLLCLTACKSKDNAVTEEDGFDGVRKEIVLNNSWQTVMVDNLPGTEDEFLKNTDVEKSWEKVNVPHNWDRYEGYRRMLHGNLHGTAWYRKKIELNEKDKEKRHFLFFEGVGSYATVWVNGEKVGEHKGGRTTFTLDITDAVEFNKLNVILVKAEHPAFIADLPWVCGGCSGEWGFSEGSQPLGIFRPVTLVITDQARIEPFGIHIWNKKDISAERAKLYTSSEIKNYGVKNRNLSLVNELKDEDGNVVLKTQEDVILLKGEKKLLKKNLPIIENPHLWSPDNPYMYSLTTSLYESGELIDNIVTPYGIRWISWPIGREGEDNRLFVNGKPVFINGTCEYEHNMGRSHAFTNEQIEARVEQVKAAGFNSFREGHQPHNLRYQDYCDESGILFWSQFSAHIWYDTPEFKENFKKLLREWIKERRNSPSVIMWGLQNESTIPEEFARECTEIIREMDPSASSQRLVTTCNGGEGTDWNVIQNWSGTYGGDPYNYGEELTEQLLNGEYGAWRTTDMHTEGAFDQEGIYSENRFSQLMEIKVREAESVRDKVVGQYNWLLNSHENPGRIQNGEGYRDIDRVGPVNYKGLFTAWGEPVDAYYMYRANYVSNKESPMVYIVSHSWPNRWVTTGKKDGLEVFSNCDEVELFNDVKNISLGKKRNLGRGKHFQWDNVDVQYNVLYAIGYVDGKEVAKDYIVLNNLPDSPNFDNLIEEAEVLKPNEAYNYIYRVNSGGPEITDSYGKIWSADTQKSSDETWGSLSWTDDFENLPAFYASQRRTHDPVKGTKDWNLFQDFRYGMDRLRYEFPVPDGDYQVELYFIEPWYGTGGGMDCTGWRNFDIAINDSLVLENFDIWKEAGHDKAIKKIFNVRSTNGKLKISFPNVASGQAVISAIAIATKDENVKAAPASPSNIQNVNFDQESKDGYEVVTWLDTGGKQYRNSDIIFTKLPYEVYGADWIRFSEPLNDIDVQGSFISKKDADVYVFLDNKTSGSSNWAKNYDKLEEQAENSRGDNFDVFHKEVKKGEQVLFKRKGEDGEMFTIALVPTYEMTEGEETRTTVTLEAENVTMEGQGIVQDHFKKSDYIEFTKNNFNSITFKVNPGLAGIFLMRFRYMNMNEDPIKVSIQIEDANGISVRNDEIEFPPAGDKWRILNTTSGGYINAGNYKINLKSEKMKGLRLDSFEFQ